MSDDTLTPEFAAAFVAALAELNDPGRSRTADTGGYTYKYVDLSGVLSECRPVLGAHGLALHQEVATEGIDDHHVAVAVRTVVVHVSGARYRSPLLTLVAPPDPQRIGSAISYGRRYSAMAALGLAAADEDDDAASAKPAPSAEKQPAKAPAKQPPAVRSTAEQQIRLMLDDVAPDVRQRVQAAFTEQFGTNLAGLPTDDHRAALNFVINRLDPDHPTNVDAAARAEADAAHAQAETP